MADIIRGRPPSQNNLPEYVSDFILIHETKWDLDRIKSLNPKDRRAFNIMAQFSYNAKLQSRGIF